ncbi:sarcocystatin-A-like [Haematobia irritans]|uniref:sarcocystatin-A-like n=1 Tax=Haematobia irritans TaxID=7368 RepID=UPI003F4F7942
MNKIIILGLLVTFCALINAQTDEPIVLKVRGGARNLEGDELIEAKEVLMNSLGTLAKGEEGPKYKLGKINKASKQLVAGTLYKFEAEIIDEEEHTKDCNIKIWSQPWLDNGTEVTFECGKEESLIRYH